MIKNVYVWDNQMVMVFDEKGQQLPDYQGPIDEVWEKIEADKSPETVITGGAWRDYKHRFTK
jgi:hypothetical protein